MSYHKTPERIYAEELCRKNPKLPDREVARMLYNSKFKDKFSEYEYARAMIRRVKGHFGAYHRAVASNKELMTAPNYNKVYIRTKDSKQYKDATKRKLVESKYYMITWAQNNTKVHDGLWREMMAYRKKLNAELHVILGRYKNPTSIRESDSSEEWWDAKILPYADAKRHNIHKYLTLLSDVKTQPTAINPLTGMEGFSGLSSSILGHPKQQFKVVAALEGYEPKMMFTTGAITEKNYSDSTAGKKGAFHHILGFVIVEVKDEETFFIRQVTACNDGSFTDLIYSVSGGEVKKIKEISYANIGDKHIGTHCPLVEKQQEIWLNYFKPKYTLIHDAFNGTSVNHHIEKDGIKKYLLQQNGDNLIKKEFDNLYLWVNKWLKYNLVFIASNHNDWIDRYINRKAWVDDIPNAAEYAKFLAILLSGEARDGIVAYLLRQKFGNKIKTVGRNDSFRINSIELSQHGDIGTNGAKGGMVSFKRLSTKMDVMHSHSPSRDGGVMYGGTSTVLRESYNVGASNWKNADIICHKDGKRQHIIYMGANKEFTTFKF